MGTDPPTGVVRSRRWYPVLLALGLFVAACSSGSDEHASAAETPGSPEAVTGEPIALVVDTDMGADDIIALAYLLTTPAVEIRAVTIAGSGLTRCGPGVTNALTILEMLEAPPVPVACGSEAPSSGSNAFPSAWRDQADEFYGLLADPGSRTGDSRSAVDLLTDVITSSEQAVTVLTLGPLTNVAGALGSGPALIENVRHIYSMGGALDAAGNVEGSPAAEWNFFVDPAAARSVLDSFPTTLIALDATNAVPLTPEMASELAGIDSLGADLVAELIDRNGLDSGGFFLWDPFAAAAVVDESVAVYEMADVAIDDSGATVRSSAGSRVRVAVEGNALRFKEVLAHVVAGESSAPDSSVNRPTVPPGRLVWKVDLLEEGITGPGAKSRGALDDGVVYFAGYDGNLYALDTSSGETIWTTQIARTAPVFVEVAMSSDALFYQATDEGGTEGGTLVAIDREDGARLWQRTFSEDEGAVRIPAYADGLVFSGTADGGFFATDAASGVEIWRTPAKQADLAGAAATADGVVYFGDVNGTVHAVDAATGNELWRIGTRPSNHGVAATPAVGDSRVFFGSDSGQIVAVDKASGEILWEVDVSPVNGLPSSPVIGDGVVYLGVIGPVNGGFGGMLALDVVTGEELWRWGSEGNAVLSSPALDDNVLYFGDSATGVLVALDAVDGTERWTFPVGALDASPVVGGGVVYVQGPDAFYAITAP